MKKSLLALFILIFCVSVYATKTDPIPSGTAAASRVLPIASKADGYPYNPKTSFSQSIYTKEELGSSAKEITAVEFFIHTSVAYSSTRTLQVWIKEIDKDSFEINLSDAQFYLVYDEISGTPKQYLPGTKVFDGSVTIPASGSYTITFDDAFDWSGNKNICVTVADLTCTSFTYTDLRHAIVPTDRPRFNYRYSNSTSSSDWYWVYNGSLDFFGLKGASELRGMKWIETAEANVKTQCANHNYAPKAVFTFGDEVPTPPSTPDDLAVSTVSATSATLEWSFVSGATSYDLQQSANGSDWSTLSLDETGTSYTWTGLSASSTQYARIRAHNDAGDSEWSDAVTVTTDAVHEHNSITFSKWTSTTSLPTSGNYYINSDMNFEAYSTAVITLSGDLNLCLNGKTVNMESARFVVPSGKTLTIYDNVGGGKITSYVASEVGANEDYNTALVVVKSGGTLVLKEGVIENTYDYGDDYKSYAVYSNGTLMLSGAPIINGIDADIYLSTSGVITLGGALTNSEKYSVKKYYGSQFTSGWSTNMSGADPKDYFISADPEKSVYYNENEAALRTLLNLSESSSNSSIALSNNKTVDVNLTRTLVSSQYNTFCLPFALTVAQMEDIFGTGYDLEEFTGSSLDGDVLELTFASRTALEAGKPYLLKPASDVANPSFEGVTIAATSPVDINTTYINFKGVYAPTELEGGNYNLLFLGANNELFWPESDGDLKGFRAYFEVKGSAQAVARRARIVKQENTATGIETITNDQSPITNKVLRNGQLLILRDNKTYNVLGLEIR